MSLWLLTSCMAMEPGIMSTDTISISGIVTDDAGNPINHIKVTLEWDEASFSPLSVYTSTNGEFYADLDFHYLRYPTTVSIGLSDPDGPENGGEFETLTDQIILFQNVSKEGNGSISLDYQMTRATREENNPQS